MEQKFVHKPCELLCDSLGSILKDRAKLEVLKLKRHEIDRQLCGDALQVKLVQP